MYTDIRIGTSGWYYDHWKGIFYSSDLPKNKWLTFYYERFNTVEINATFYRHFNDSTFFNWATVVPGDFLFVFKASRIITHRKYLKNCREDIKAFERQCLLIRKHYGMTLLQLPPGLKYEPELLHDVLGFFSYPEKVAVEFRHPSWFNEKTAKILSGYGACMCNVDAPTLQEIRWITGENVYIRLHGRSHWYRHDYTEKELQETSEYILDFAKEGAKRIFVFFNNDFRGYAISNAILLKQILDRYSG
ncbi:MAG: DUF72 domain-containing protein [Bacteroidales bacterium]|nr:DUF72 domain-containing protein [Bacteroidales bacterium]